MHVICNHDNNTKDVNALFVFLCVYFVYDNIINIYYRKWHLGYQMVT